MDTDTETTEELTASQRELLSAAGLALTEIAGDAASALAEGDLMGATVKLATLITKADDLGRVTTLVFVAGMDIDVQNPLPPEFTPKQREDAVRAALSKIRS